MADYSSLKVSELKKLLGERGLTQTGNKADLVARLQENDAATEKSTSKEDEIDWDDEQPVTDSSAKPVASSVPAGESQAKVPGELKTSEVRMPSADANTAPAKGTAQKDTATKVSGSPAATTDGTNNEGTAKDLESGSGKVTDISLHLAATDIDEEAKKRAARAKRFGLVEDEEDKKKAERAARFGIDGSIVTKSLDAALPDRPRKRGRGGDGGEDGDDAAGNKRSTPDRRTGDGSGRGRNQFRQRNGGRRGGQRHDGLNADQSSNNRRTILDDPVERQKAENRAKRFAT